MTHTQTQGADGAGTKTAKPGDLLYRSEWETKRTITHEDAREIAGRLIASRFRRTDCETARASIPANPDYDDDLLINSYIKQQARKEAAHATPAPAATPGVPDSVRALLERLAKASQSLAEFPPNGLVRGDLYVAAKNEGQGTGWRYVCSGASVSDLDAAASLIAAQPAGQAGDAGAETERLREAVSKALHDNQFLDDWREMVDPVVDAALAARPEAPSDAGWSFDMEAAPRDGTPINVGRDNGCGWDLLVVWWSKSATEYPWHTEGGGEYPEHRFDCWATLTPPSDPAPSGQAEG